MKTTTGPCDFIDSKSTLEIGMVLEEYVEGNMAEEKCTLEMVIGTETVENDKQESGSNITRIEEAGLVVQVQKPECDIGLGGEACNSQSGMEKRKQYWPKKKLRIQCQICKALFSDGSNLKRHHKRMHHTVPFPRRIIKPKKSNILKCPYCSKVIKSTSYLTIHIRIHRPPGMQLYSCGFCSKEFIHRQTWKKHLRIHSDLRPYSCSKCEFTAKFRTHLNQHEKRCYKFRRQEEMARKCRPRFNCDICGKTFFAKTSLCYHKAITGGNCKAFTCNVCDKKFYDKNKFAEHIAVAHTDEYPFPCTICDSKFKFKADLTNHTGRTHTQRWICPRVGCTVELLSTTISTRRRHLKECSKPIQCKTCEQIFESQELYADHSHPIQCPKCERTCSKQSQMDRHLVYHDPLNIYKCESCTFGFSTTGELAFHQKLNHKNEHYNLKNFTVRPENDIFCFTCKFCSTKFENPTAPELTDHAKNSHSEKIGRYMCPSCGRGFKTEVCVILHRKNVHGMVETDFRCETCELYFLNKHGLEIHNGKVHQVDVDLVGAEIQISGIGNQEQQPSARSRACKNPKKHICLICGMKCRKDGLGKHLNLHKMDKEFKCELCTRSWAAPQRLNNHNRACHSNLQIEPIETKCFACPYCEMKFKSSSVLRDHVRLHTNEKPFSCQICSKNFTRMCKLVDHQYTHSGEKSVFCDYCGAAFTRIGQRDAHVRTYHKIHAKKPSEVRTTQLNSSI